MSAGTDKVKRYVGLASNALAYALQADTAIKQDITETEPPVGSKGEFGGRSKAAAVAVGGISGTTVLIAVGAYFFLFRK